MGVCYGCCMTGAESSAIVGIVLAAGRSHRTGFPKALATLDGETLVGRALRVLEEGGCRYGVVVVAPPHGAAIARAVGGAELAHNPAPERGMSSSLQAGIRRAFELVPDAVAIVFMPVDLPLLRSSTVARLVTEFRESPRAILRPTCSGRGGHPVLLAARVARAVAESQAPTPRDALREAGAITDVEVGDPGVLRDLDTLEDVLEAGVKPPA
jgi:CTP:molybdopterin cytidylyltransferase MocA